MRERALGAAGCFMVERVGRSRKRPVSLRGDDAGDRVVVPVYELRIRAAEPSVHRDHLGRLAKPRVDDLEALVAETAGEDLCAAVVAIEPGLGDEDLDRPVVH